MVIFNRSPLGSKELHDKQSKMMRLRWEKDYDKYYKACIQGSRLPNNKGRKQTKSAIEARVKGLMKTLLEHPEIKLKQSDSRKALWEKPEFYIRRFDIWYGAVTYDDNPYCELWTEELKERVRASHNYCCVLCGTPQNGKRLHVHHVLWNKKTCCDGSKQYLLPLCISCHNSAKGNKIRTRKDWMNEMVMMIENYWGGKCFLTKEEWGKIKNTPTIPLETRYSMNRYC